ncbi:MAG TPA: creatininase family protein [Gemmatimonadales bacterium]|nr:creatininase family protein [Gemmatimonadales bacterium]
MRPAEIETRLRERSILIVPVGTTEQHGPHLPLGCDTIILEHLSDDLSASSGVIRAPTVEYGVHTGPRPLPGGAALRRKTLRRVMNELIESWEEGAGVESFLILTAEANDAHQEALSTIRSNTARITAVDIYSLDFEELLDRPAGRVHGSELDTSLVLFLAPELVRMDLARDVPPTPELVAESHRADQPVSIIGYPTEASAAKGAALYNYILERISRCLAEC